MLQKKYVLNSINIIQYLLFSIAANRSRSFTLSGNSNLAVSAMVGGGSQGTPNSCVSYN